MNADQFARHLGMRIDRLPSSRTIWRLILPISLGGFFEIYDISLTPFLSPALVAAGVFHKGTKGLLGFSDQASFIAATFAGLWIGTLVFSFVADRVGRRAVFAYSMLWYCVATVVMGLQNSALSVDIWRLIAGIGTGTQLVTIDCYLAEITPRRFRGRAFALSTFIQFLAYPCCAFLSVGLAGRELVGVAGWRWLAFIPAIGAVIVWNLHRALPESPRWLAARGQGAAAERIVAGWENEVQAVDSAPLSPSDAEGRGVSAPAEPVDRRTYRRRLVMMAVFQLLQAVGFYGFNSWAPSLIEARGVSLRESLSYTAAIAVIFPLTPLLFSLFADRIERKWQIALGASLAACFGLLFAAQRAPAGWIVCGLLITVASNLMSYGYHAYQSEIFPTRVRARAIGITYSFSRLSAIFSSYLIAYLLTASGPTAVFILIAGCLFGVAALIGGFGPRTSRLSLEDIAH